jgi:hypothetical protein
MPYIPGPVNYLRDVLGYPHEEAQRALDQANGDIDRAGIILLEGAHRQLRRLQAVNYAETPSQTAGPLGALPTPPGTASPESNVVEISDDEQSASDSYYDETYTPENNDHIANYETEDQQYEYQDDRREHHGHVKLNINHYDEWAQCICTLNNHDQMISCSTCGRWFHYECVHLTPETIPAGDWFCHFEASSSTKPYNNSGNRMNDLESRALFLTVRYLAPLSSKFWEAVSEHMRTQFNILRSVTSVKMEWLRYSSAWWGFDERNCRQYREEDRAERRSLYRSSQKDAKQPPLLWFYLEMPLRQPGEEGSGRPKERKPRFLVRKEKPEKRKRVVVIDDSDSDDQMPVPANKRRHVYATATPTPAVVRRPVNVISMPPLTAMPRQMPTPSPAPLPTVGGKYVASQEVFATPAVQTSEARKIITEARVMPTASANVGSATAAAAGLASAKAAKAKETEEQAQEQAIASLSALNPIEQQPITASSVPPTIVKNGIVVGTLPDLFSADSALHQAAYNPTSSIDYQFCSCPPAPIYESRFDALAAHRREVKEMLKDIEPILDWSEGPWTSAEELLWTGDEEAQFRAMFPDA